MYKFADVMFVSHSLTNVSCILYYVQYENKG